MELDFDFRKRGRSINDVGHLEQNAALDYLMDFLTYRLKDKTSAGCYSEEALGCPAVEYFASIAMSKVFGGYWTWKEETKLTTLLCNCAWSEMGHWSRDWKKKRDKGELEPQPISFVANPESYLDKLEAEANQMKEEERQAADEQEEQQRTTTFTAVLDAVKDDRELVRYVKAVRDLDTYHDIEKRLKVKKEKREEIEARLMERLKVAKLHEVIPLRGQQGAAS